MKKEKSLHEMAVRLCEGGHVCIVGHFLKAVEVTDGFDPCNECDLDSVCVYDVQELCAECDSYTGTKHLLKFVHQK